MQNDHRRSPAKIESAEQRRERLASELRANLMKRKSLARTRTAQDKNSGPNGDEEPPL